MKKLLFLLAVAGLISFAACKSGETKSDATPTDSIAPTEAAAPDSVPAVAPDSVPAQK